MRGGEILVGASNASRPVRPVDRAAAASRSLRELAAGFSGRLAVAARAEDTGELLAFDPDRVMPTASVIKLAVLVEVFRQDAAGLLSLDERLVLDETNRVGGSGVLKDLSPGVALTVRDYATLMITVSDNAATNMLIDRIGGVTAVNELVRDRLGLTTLRLHRKVSLPPAPGTDPDRRTPLGEASPRHLVALLSLLWRRRLVTAQACEQMLTILGRQQHLDQVPRFLDCELMAARPAPTGDILVACKTGMVDGTRADAGLLLLRGRPVSYAVMSTGCSDRGLHPDHEGVLVNAAVGEIIAKRFWPGPGPVPVRPGHRQRRVRSTAGPSSPGDRGDQLRSTRVAPQ